MIDGPGSLREPNAMIAERSATIGYNESMDRAPSFPSSRRPIPAWLLSAILHGSCLLLLAVVYKPGHSVPADEMARRVSIVLTERRVEQPSQLPTDPQESEGASAAVNMSSLPTAEMAANMTPVGLALPGSQELTSLDPATLLDAPRTDIGSATSVPAEIDPTAILAEEANRRRRQAALGPVTRVQLFGGAPATGRSFVFLIDRSKSMGSQGLGAMKAAEQELLNSLSALESNHRFQVIAYHHQCVYLLERKLLPATPENLEAIQGHLSNLAAFGATEHQVALRTALYLEPDAIFLLTDGGEPTLTSAQLKMIRKRAAGRTVIHCIQFGFGPQRETENFLTRLAAENNGGYGYVDMSNTR